MRPERPGADADAVADDAPRALAAGSLDGVQADPARPWTWSAPLLALGRTPVRIHASFLALVLLQCLRVIRPGPSGPLPPTMAQMLVAMVTLAWLSLLADGAREWAARRGGARPGPMVIWPAGGLSWRDTPGPWSTRLAASLAAPVASVCVAAALGIALMSHSDRWDVALPSPWSTSPLEQLGAERLWSTLWLVHWTNIALLAASVIPAHPFAGGRVVEAALEPWLGRDGAMRASAMLGIISGIAIAIAGLAFGSILSMLCGAVAVGSSTAGARAMGIRPGMLGVGLWTTIVADATASSRARAAARASQQAREDDAALDGILEKVARLGMGALSVQEKRVLARATARRRSEQAHGTAPGAPPSGDASRGGAPDDDPPSAR
jgi:hypothetical protein